VRNSTVALVKVKISWPRTGLQICCR